MTSGQRFHDRYPSLWYYLQYTYRFIVPDLGIKGFQVVDSTLSNFWNIRLRDSLKTRGVLGRTKVKGHLRRMLLLLRDPPVKRCMLPNNTRRGRIKTNGMCGTKSSHDTTGCEEPKNRTRFWSVGLLKTQNSLSKLENRTMYLVLDFDCVCRQVSSRWDPFTSIGRSA